MKPTFDPVIVRLLPVISIFVAIVSSSLHASDRQLYRAIEGEGRLVTYGRTNRNVDVTFSGCISSNQYFLSVTYPGIITINTSHDGHYTYIVAHDLHKDSYSTTNNLLPAQIASEYYPLDGDALTRSLVLFCDWIMHRAGGMSVAYDPWLEPRLQVAFEAATQHVVSTSSTNFVATYTIDPTIVKHLLRTPVATKFLRIALRSADRELWSRGYAEGKHPFTNSLWTITQLSQSEYEVASTHYESVAVGSIAGRPSEQISLKVRLGAKLSQCRTTPDTTQMRLSVYDHRFQDRNKYVDGLQYNQTNEIWRSENDAVLGKLFEHEKDMAPLRSRELSKSAPGPIIANLSIIGFIAFCVWLGVWMNSRKRTNEAGKARHATRWSDDHIL